MNRFTVCTQIGHFVMAITRRAEGQSQLVVITVVDRAQIFSEGGRAEGAFQSAVARISGSGPFGP